MSQAIDHERFIALLNERFPEVAAQIDDISEGLLHLEMATLARATQAAVDARDRGVVGRHFSFVDEVLRDAAPDVDNAVHVSYLENLEFLAGRMEARDLLPPRLQQTLAEMEEHMARRHDHGPGS